jgi:hypothetical protein
VSSADPGLKPALFSVHEHRSLLLIGGITGLGALVGGLAIHQRRRG